MTTRRSLADARGVVAGARPDLLPPLDLALRDWARMRADARDCIQRTGKDAP